MRSFPRALQLPSMQWLPLDCRSSIILGARVLQNSFHRTRLAKSSNHLHTQESVATSLGFQFKCWKTSNSTSSLRWPLVHWQVGECVQRYCFGKIIFSLSLRFNHTKRSFQQNKTCGLLQQNIKVGFLLKSQQKNRKTRTQIPPEESFDGKQQTNEEETSKTPKTKNSDSRTTRKEGNKRTILR